MKTIKFIIDELTCPGCITKIERVLSKEKGVAAADVLFSASQVKVAFRDWMISADELAILLENIGYPVLGAKVLSDKVPY